MGLNPSGSWSNTTPVYQRRFTCGYAECSREVASNIGWLYKTAGNSSGEAYAYVCPMCHGINIFEIKPSNRQTPGISYGRPVEHLPKDIDDLYGEIRNSTSAGAYTSAVLACRKILMHIAVERGAKAGQSFVSYVQYLVEHHYAPPGTEPWVDKIRQSGNEATHEIKIMTADDARELINFTEMLLKFIYEFPAKLLPAPPLV